MLIDHLALADHVVGQEQPAGPGQFEGPIQVARVVVLVGVDKHQIKERLALELGQPVQG